jgi:hypothetical protein
LDMGVGFLPCLRGQSASVLELVFELLGTHQAPLPHSVVIAIR